MIRPLALLACTALALAAKAQPGAVEAIPVDHREPITVRILDGASGQPLGRVRLILTAGYNARDINHRLWREEALTNPFGEARLPSALINFPLLQVSLLKVRACQAGSQQYGIDRIRNDGLTAANRCGIVDGADAPGVLNLFARRRWAGPAPASISPPAPVRADFPGPGDSPPAGPGPPSLPASNEIRSLIGHPPLGTPVSPTAAGTAESTDSYEEMCVPEH